MTVIMSENATNRLRYWSRRPPQPA